MSSVDSVRCEFRSVWSWWGMKAGSTTQVPVEQAWVEIEQMVYSFLECLNTHWLWNPVSCSWVFAQRNESIHPHKSWECPWPSTWYIHTVKCCTALERNMTGTLGTDKLQKHHAEVSHAKECQLRGHLYESLEVASLCDRRQGRPGVREPGGTCWVMEGSAPWHSGYSTWCICWSI